MRCERAGPSVTVVIAVVSDASVALKWFHAQGEEEVEASRELVSLFGRRVVSLAVLNLTKFELGNALLRGRAQASAAQVSTVVGALAEICPAIEPSTNELAVAADLADQHDLTLYDATYAAVAQARGAELASLDKALLKAGLARPPAEVVALVAQAG